MKKKTLLLSLAVIAGLTSCKKEEATKPATVPDAQTSPFKTNIACPAGPQVVGVRVTKGGYPNSIDISNTGVVTINGGFSGTIDLDPATGVFNVTAPQGVQGLYQQRINASGFFVSGSYVGEYTYEMGLVKDAQGNKYDLTVVDNPDQPQPAQSEARIVISKYSPSGALLGQVNGGNINRFARVGTVKINSQGHIIFANPMGTLYRFTSAGQLIGTTPYNDYDAMVELDQNDNIYIYSVTTGKLQKFSSTGTRIWAVRNEPTAGLGPKITNLAFDNSGNIYAAGSLYETSDLDPGPGVFKAFKTKPTEDIFVQKLSPDGQFIWAMYTNGYFGGNNPSVTATAIKVDPSGEYIVVGGYLSGYINFNPTGDLLLANTNQYDTYSYIWGIRQCK